MSARTNLEIAADLDRLGSFEATTQADVIREAAAALRSPATPEPEGITCSDCGALITSMREIAMKGDWAHHRNCPKPSATPAASEAHALARELREEARCLADAVADHKTAKKDWLRDDGKRSVTIVEYQLNKNDLGSEARLLERAAALIDRLVAAEPDEATHAVVRALWDAGLLPRVDHWGQAHEVVKAALTAHRKET